MMPFTPREVQREVQQAAREMQDVARRALHLPQARVRLRTLFSILADTSPGPPGQAPLVTFHEIGLRSVVIFGSIWWAALWGLVGLIVAIAVFQAELNAEQAALIVVLYPLAGAVFFTPVTTAIAALYNVIARRFGGFEAVLTELHTARNEPYELDVTVHGVRVRSAFIFGGVWWVSLWTAVGFVTTLLEISGLNANRFGMYAFFYLPVIYGAVFTGASVLLALLYNLVAEKWRGFVVGLTELEELHDGRPDICVTVHRIDLRSVLAFGSLFWLVMMFIPAVTVSLLSGIGVIDTPLGALSGLVVLGFFVPLTLLTAALTLIYNGVAQSYGGFELTLCVPPEVLGSGPIHDLAHLNDTPDAP
jgi:hypothetical protein